MTALPEGRYGKPATRHSRRTKVIFAVLGILVGGLLAFVANRNLGTAPIEAERTGFANLPGNQMKLMFTVTRQSPERAAVCIVRTRGGDGGEVGRKEVYIAAGASPTLVETVIVSSAEPVTADVFGCSYQVPAYLSTGQPPTE